MQHYAERFSRKYTMPKGIFGCWEWTTAKNYKGYGAFSYGGNNIAAHRISYELYHGEFPVELLVRHKCDNPGCVNPFHLELGTAKDNRQDAVTRGRTPTGEKHHTVSLKKEDFDEVKRLLNTKMHSISSIARMTGIGRKTVERVKDGLHWSC